MMAGNIEGDGVLALNHAPNNRSMCKGPKCKGEKLQKGAVRFELAVFGQRGRQTSWACADCVVSDMITEAAKTARGKCKQTGEQFKKGEVKLGFRGHTSTVQADGTYEHASPTWTKLAAGATLLPAVIAAGGKVNPVEIAGYADLDADSKGELEAALADVLAAPVGEISEPYPGPCRCKGCREAISKKRKSEDAVKKRKSGEMSMSQEPDSMELDLEAEEEKATIKKLRREVSIGMLPPPVLEHPPAFDGKRFDLISWNVDGIRATGRADGLRKLVEVYKPDLLCIQETKLQTQHEEEWMPLLAKQGYSGVFHSSEERKGYAGTALYIKDDASCQPVGPPSFGIGLPPGPHNYDGEGRTMTIEYPTFYVVNCYVPNSGMALDRLDDRVGRWDVSLRAYLKKLEAKKPVILTGDLNCAHLKQDNYGYFKAHVEKIPGCTTAERESFGKFFDAEFGFKDAFRELFGPVEHSYTYFSQKHQRLRPENRGLRLDYFICSANLFGEGRPERVHDVVHFQHNDPKICPLTLKDGAVLDKLPSDHVPVALQLALK